MHKCCGLAAHIVVRTNSFCVFYFQLGDTIYEQLYNRFPKDIYSQLLNCSSRMQAFHIVIVIVVRKNIIL